MALSIRPSDYVGLTGYEAFCFDEALLILNGEIEERLKPIVDAAKDGDDAAKARSRWLMKYFGGPEADRKVKGQFRDPAAAFQ